MIIDVDYGESRTKQKQRNAILQEAYCLFLQQGIEGVSMQDIAAVCGIQRRSLYNYYSKKEEIALDLMKCWYKALAAMMDGDLPQGETGFEVIKAGFYQFYARLIENADMIQYSVQFDHYFRHDYHDTSFDGFLLRGFPRVVDVTMFDRGLADGSIQPQYTGKAAETLLTMSTSVLALAQRIMFRPAQLQREGGHTLERIHNLIDLLLEGIKNN